MLAALLLMAGCSAEAPQHRAPLQIVTGLPLFWGEGGIGDVLDGTSKPSPLISALQSDGPVVAVDRVNKGVLRDDHLLVLIQPPPLAPDELVTLDDWVRGGGHAVILADPDLVWGQQSFPGDPRRAPSHSMLGPLFAHWGLTLSPSGALDEPVDSVIEGQTVTLVRPGLWSSNSSDCVVPSNRHTASCRLGKGRVLLIGDVDFADPSRWAEWDDNNLEGLKAALRATSPAKSPTDSLQRPEKHRTSEEQMSN
jgi:hypothetical protein